MRSRGDARSGELGRPSRRRGGSVEKLLPRRGWEQLGTPNEKIASPTHLPGRISLGYDANHGLDLGLHCPSHLWTNIDCSSTLLSFVTRLSPGGRGMMCSSQPLPIHYPPSDIPCRRKWPIHRSRTYLHPPRQASAVERRRRARRATTNLTTRQYLSHHNFQRH